MADRKYKLSPGKIVTIVALFFACVFGLVVLHGVHMIEHHQQNAERSS